MGLGFCAVFDDTGGLAAGAVCGLGDDFTGFAFVSETLFAVEAALVGFAAVLSLVLFAAIEVRDDGLTSPFVVAFFAPRELRGVVDFTSPFVRSLFSAETAGFVAETLDFATVVVVFGAVTGVVFATAGFAGNVFGVALFVVVGVNVFLAPKRKVSHISKSL